MLKMLNFDAKYRFAALLSQINSNFEWLVTL